MIPRKLTSSMLKLLGKYPVLTLTGPRQSGKTTLLKSLFKDWNYLSMETPDIRQQVLENPRGLFAKLGHRMVIDEVQRTPDLLSYIQTIVDEDPDACFILSGSHNLLMLEHISQSLAGRSAIFYLLPLSLEELSSADYTFDKYEDLILNGCYPRIYDKELLPHQFYPNYLETYIQRDVRLIKNVGNLSLFTRFLSVCAGYIGQSLNYSNLANETGLSVSTAKNWISVLETSFIVYLVNPYFRNFNKRITKSPRLYFYDTGLACSLLRINKTSSLENYFQKGALFENFIVNEMCKHYFNLGARPPIYFWRDHNQREIDVLMDLGGELVPIEIKSSRTYNSAFFKNIAWFQEISQIPISNSFVIYGGDANWEMEHGKLISWRSLNEIFNSLN